jgi:hypothetical protein
MLRTTGVAAAALVTASLVGCGHAIGPAPSPAEASATRLLDESGYAQALRGSYKDYAWPAGYRPDLRRLAADSGPPPNARVEAGSEKMVLSLVNTCAWYLSWDSEQKTNHHAETAHALDVMLNRLPALAPDPAAGRKLAVDIARSAAAGNSGPALEFVQNNCSNIQWTG